MHELVARSRSRKSWQDVGAGSRRKISWHEIVTRARDTNAVAQGLQDQGPYTGPPHGNGTAFDLEQPANPHTESGRVCDRSPRRPLQPDLSNGRDVVTAAKGEIATLSLSLSPWGERASLARPVREGGSSLALSSSFATQRSHSESAISVTASVGDRVLRLRYRCTPHRPFLSGAAQNLIPPSRMSPAPRRSRSCAAPPAGSGDAPA